MRPRNTNRRIDRATRARWVTLAALDVPASDADVRRICGREDEADDMDVVVSPLCNAAHELTGAIYGFRSVRAGE